MMNAIGGNPICSRATHEEVDESSGGLTEWKLQTALQSPLLPLWESRGRRLNGFLGLSLNDRTVYIPSELIG